MEHIENHVENPTEAVINGTDRLLKEGYRRSGFWIRVAALFIDALCLGLAQNIIMIIFLPGALADSAESLTTFHVFSVLTGFAFYIGLWAWKGTTPGKWLFGMNVVDAKTGEKLSTLQSTIRYFGYILSSIFFIGYLMVAFTDSKRGLHDFLSGSVVLRKPKKA